MNKKNTLHRCKVSVSCYFYDYLFSSSVIPDLNSKISLLSKTVIFSMSLLTTCSSYSVTRLDCVCRNCHISSIRFFNISCSASLVTTAAFFSLKASHRTQHSCSRTLQAFPEVLPSFGRCTQELLWSPHSVHLQYCVVAVPGTALVHQEFY